MIKDDSEAIVEKKEFNCYMCGLFAKYNYFGNFPLKRNSDINSKSSNSKSEDIVLLEKSFISDDPFDVQNNTSFLILGSMCNICNQMVCNSNSCSFFYFKKRFCFKCAVNIDLNEFPKEIQMEIKKYSVNQK